MSRELFLKKLQMFQTSSAPIEIKEKAIAELKQKYLFETGGTKSNMILSSIYESSSELKPEEIF